MANTLETLKLALHSLRQRDAKRVLLGIRNQIVRSSVSIGLRRDLSEPFVGPAARVPLIVREVSPSEVTAILYSAALDGPLHERRDREVRLAHASEKLGRAFIAYAAESHQPCFIQWIMSAADNQRIQRFFRGRFPPLKPDEVLFENALTLPAFRGLGIMSCAMSRIAEIAKQRGFRYGLTFVAESNVASLRACAKAGFSPSVVRRDRALCMGLLRHRRFEPLGPDAAAATFRQD